MPAEELTLRLATSYLDMETDDDANAVLAAYRADPAPATLMADHHPGHPGSLSRLVEFVLAPANKVIITVAVTRPAQPKA